MANVVIFDEAATPQKVLGHLKSVHTPDYLNRSDVVINPQLNALEGIVPRKYWKHENGAIVEYTQAEKTAQDTAGASSAELATRVSAKANLDGFVPDPLFHRALVAVVLDELNVIRAIPNVGLSALTLTSLLSAIDAKVDSGSVDS